MIRFCQLIEPALGGINLEDIKAPECFRVEEALKKSLSIPVFHDDQHGTAIISGAALLNALEVAEKKNDEVRVVFCGAGASGIACAKFYLSLGLRPENLTMVDSKGVIYKGRVDGMNAYKKLFARETDMRYPGRRCARSGRAHRALGEGYVHKGDDCRHGENSIIFAMANPSAHGKTTRVSSSPGSPAPAR